MVREFFKAGGRPESRHDAEVRAKVEELSRRKIQESEHLESAEAYRPILKQFPFKWLNSNFRHLHERSGIKEKFQDLIDGGNGILWSEQIGEMGTYEQVSNIIRLNPIRIENKISRAAEYEVTPELARKLLLARVLIHEATHMYSKTTCKGIELLRKANPGKLKVETGLETQVYNYPGNNEGLKLAKRDYRDFNEGIVDFVAEDIFERYLEREGLANSPETDKFKEYYLRVADPYKTQRDIILATILKMSADAGVSHRVAYEGLINQLQAEGPLNAELRAWMEELYGKKIAKMIKDNSLYKQSTEGIEL